MLRPKYRNIIPNELEEKKNKDKSAYCEIYDVGGLDSKAKLLIKSLYTEKSNFEIHGNFLYQIKNCSHFEIDSELDFSKSSNYRTQEKNVFEPNKTLFKSHIEPFQDLNKNIIKEKNKKEEEEDGICKVQYNRGYKIKVNIKLAFTFPSVEKQISFVKEEHKEILEFLEQWKKFRPSQIEQLLLFYDDNNFNDINNDINKKSMKKYNSSINNNSDNYNVKRRNIENNNIFKRNRYSFEILREFANDNNLYISREVNENKVNSIGINNENNINQTTDKIICFVDESFPPFQEEYRLIDLNTEITTTKRFDSTEKNEDKKRKIVFHYRPIENLLPEQKQIFNVDEINPYDIKSGLFKNINIISVFAHLADYPYILSKIFIENNINSFGIYKLKLFYQNYWTDIYVDKYIPCFPCYFPLYTYSPSSLWPSLLEKGLAKIFRGYNKLKYVSYFELYQILTGFPIINFKKIYKNVETKILKEMFELLLNNKDAENLSEYISDFNFVVNSKYSNKAVETVSKIDIIKSYLCYDFNNINNNDDDTNSNAFGINNNDDKSFAIKSDESDNFQNKIIFNNEIYFKNSYLMGFYASESYLKYLSKIEFFPLSKKNLLTISNRIFPVKYANEKFVIIKSIYNYQLKKLLNTYFSDDTNSFNIQNDNGANKAQNLTREADTLTFTWDILLTLFDNVILIKSNNYDELHFRNGFIRCQDVKSPDYDRVLAHSYYELYIKKSKNEREIVRNKEEIKDKKIIEEENNKINSEKKNKDNINGIKSINTKFDTINYFNNKNKNRENSKKDIKKNLIPVTIVINLSNEHFLDSSYYSREIDFKIGILKLQKKNKINHKETNNKKNAVYDPFNGLNPILITCPDFQIGYSLVYDLFLEEGNYIIVPMTMGYCMQKNEKIKSYYYSLRDKDGLPLPINKTVIPRFLDDVFYLNDPFGHNYLDYKVINEIAKNILDNKGHKIKKIDENSLYNNYSKIGDSDNIIKDKDKFGLSKLSFEDFIFEEMTLLTELQKKQCMQNLGYENNTYPYLSRFIGVSFYFGKFKNHSDKDIIKITPKNNLLDSNMDKYVNVRTLEKSINQIKDNDYNKPKRIHYPLQGWYSIEGVYMEKNYMGKNEKKIYDFEKEKFNGKNVFFSTNNNNITAMVHPGKIKFLLYVVSDVINSSKRKKNKEEENSISIKNESLRDSDNINNEEEEDINNKSKAFEKSSTLSKKSEKSDDE